MRRVSWFRVGSAPRAPPPAPLGADCVTLITDTAHAARPGAREKKQERRERSDAENKAQLPTRKRQTQSLQADRAVCVAHLGARRLTVSIR